jgi:hypothetical protein
LTAKPLPHLPLNIWFTIVTFIPNPTTLWLARALSPALQTRIEAYFQKVFIAKHVQLVDYAYKTGPVYKEGTEYEGKETQHDGQPARLSCYSPDGRVVQFDMKSTYSESRGRAVLKLLLLGGKEEEGEMRVWGLVSCGEFWDDGEWRAVSYTGYDGTNKVTMEKERDVWFNREGRVIGFDWREMMTRVLVHPRWRDAL